MAAAERPASILINWEPAGTVNTNELKQLLMDKDVESKIDAMRQIVSMMVNGEPLNSMFMPVTQFVGPARDHMLKKLLLLYWEVIEKRGPDGRLKQEMIMVCNALLANLNHPNEYVRGRTLRFLCQLKEPELLENLLKAIKENLFYTHPYVRRNAVLAVASIYRTAEQLLPDAPELIEKALLAEKDASARRNAFAMLALIDQDRALRYLASVLDEILSLDVPMQLAAISLIAKVSRTNAAERARFARAIVELLTSPSNAVKFEAASVLVATTSSVAAARQAAQCFIDVLCSEPENTVKLIVLERLADMQREHASVLQDLALDLLRALVPPNLEIRRRVLQLVQQLLSPRNVAEVVGVLKREVLKTQAGGEGDKAQLGEYRHMLVSAIHACADTYPEVAESVVYATAPQAAPPLTAGGLKFLSDTPLGGSYVLLEFLSDASSTASAVDVIAFVREVLESYPQLRPSLVAKLIAAFPTLKAQRVYRAVLWILGEYSTSPEHVAAAFNTIKSSLGDVPFTAAASTGTAAVAAPGSISPRSHVSSERAAAAASSASHKLLPDGTYATQVASVAKAAAGAEAPVSLRTFLLGGDFFVAAVAANALTKLVLRAAELEISSGVKNALTADVMLYLTHMLLLGRNIVSGSGAGDPHKIEVDCYERIAACLRVLATPTEATKHIFLHDCRQAYTAVLRERKEGEQRKKTDAARRSERVTQADTLIGFRQLRGRDAVGSELLSDEADVERAVGQMSASDVSSKRLKNLVQLTGLSDPIYAEATVLLNAFDITLEFLLVNRTAETLTNVSLELSALGDLKVTERPSAIVLAPRESRRLKASLKVASTESGLVFGTISYDRSGSRATDQSQILLDDIRLDIMDYIRPHTCSDSAFRTMWLDFEWENKVPINTNITDPDAFLQHLMNLTHMQLLTKEATRNSSTDFVTANLYAKSIFDEDILCNVSVEVTGGRLAGSVRIRSKTQGVALGVGERITLKQRK